MVSTTVGIKNLQFFLVSLYQALLCFTIKFLKKVLIFAAIESGVFI